MKRLRHPVRAIREPFGTAGLIVACVALIAALGGSAIAASNALTGKQKKEVTKIAKKFAGKNGAPGAAGPQGPAGSPGAKGDPGAAGAEGTDGTNGLSVTGVAATAAECGGVAGGVKYTINGTTTKICNGKDGADGEGVTIIHLDKGDPNCPEGGTKLLNNKGEGFACNGTSGESVSATMTGKWEVQGENGIVIAGFASATTISFPRELAAAPSEIILINGANTEEEEDKCPGEPSEPKATAGILCLYVEFANETPTLKVTVPQKFGANVYFEKTNEAFGSWAVMPAA